MVAQVNEQNGFQAWLQCFQVNCLLSSTSLLTGWAQDKSQQAELLAACQMLLGLWLQALWIWLATLARSHLWLTQNFLFQTYFNNLMVEKLNQYMWHCFYLLRLTLMHFFSLSDCNMQCFKINLCCFSISGIGRSKNLSICSHTRSSVGLFDDAQWG